VRTKVVGQEQPRNVDVRELVDGVIDAPHEDTEEGLVRTEQLHLLVLHAKVLLLEDAGRLRRHFCFEFGNLAGFFGSSRVTRVVGNAEVQRWILWFFIFTQLSKNDFFRHMRNCLGILLGIGIE
jgi:hypothetical protein